MDYYRLGNTILSIMIYFIYFREVTVDENFRTSTFQNEDFKKFLTRFL